MSFEDAVVLSVYSIDRIVKILGWAKLLAIDDHTIWIVFNVDGSTRIS